MNYGLEHLVQKMCKIELSADVENEINAIFTDICERLHKEP